MLISKWKVFKRTKHSECNEKHECTLIWLIDWLIDSSATRSVWILTHRHQSQPRMERSVLFFLPSVYFLPFVGHTTMILAAFRLLLIVVLLSYQFLFIVVLLSLDLSILVSVTTSAYVHFCWSCCAIYPLVSVVVISLSTGVNCGLALCQHCFVLFFVVVVFNFCSFMPYSLSILLIVVLLSTFVNCCHAVSQLLLLVISCASHQKCY